MSNLWNIYIYKHCDYFLEYTNFGDYLIQYKCLCWNKNYQNQFNEKLKECFSIHTNFLTMITISLFHYYEKVFIVMNIWMIGKNSMKRHYLKKKIFYSDLNMNILPMQTMRTQKESVKILK